MGKRKSIFWLILLTITVLSCSKDDDVNSEEGKEFAKILSFTFLAAENDQLKEDAVGIINEETKEIAVTLPPNTSLNFLRPTIELSDEADGVSPPAGFPRNFVIPTEYTANGDFIEDIEDTKYTVIVNVENSKENKITVFEFTTANNPNANLLENVSGEITDTTISFEFKAETKITSLVPRVFISKGATISPTPDMAMDFTQPVEYVVTAQDGVAKKTYTIISSVLKNDKSDILGFEFKDIAGKSYTAEIDGDDVFLELPEGTPLGSLTPEIAISSGATILPKSGEVQNFEELRFYEVFSEDGKVQKTYRVNIHTSNSLNGDRAALTKLYKVNKILDNTFFLPYLDWDLNAPNMNNWEGVSINGDRVKSLAFVGGFDYRIYILPPEIGKLSELTTININIAGISKIAPEIGELKKLRFLTLHSGGIKELPKEIGQLNSLVLLSVNNTLLETIPKEISALSKLTILNLNDNKIQSIPGELGGLKGLSKLDLKTNPVTAIPNSVCALSKDLAGSTELLLDEDDVCQ